MSTQLARGPRATAEQPLSATRQQLDELDALLQRMLDLPVQPAGDEPPAEPRSPQPARREAPPPRPAAPPRKETQRNDPPPSPAPRPQPQRSEAPAPAVPPTPKISSPPRRAQAVTEAAPAPAEPKAYPASYMVVETTTPAFPAREQAQRSEAPTDAGLGPRIVVHEQSAPEEVSKDRGPGIELPVPGGRHDLEADDPVDVTEDLARLQSELSKPPEAWVPFRSSWQPSEQTWKPLAETWEQARKAPELPSSPAPEAEASQPARMPPERPAPPPDARPKLRDFPRVTMPVAPRPSDAPPSTASPDRQTAPAADSSSQTKTAPLPSAPSPPLPALPLVWFNVAFDALLTPFGPPGKWLKGKGGRGVLGFVGFLCLAGAVALAVADGIGWPQ